MDPKDRIKSSDRYMGHMTQQEDFVVIWVCPFTTTPAMHVVVQVLTRGKGVSRPRVMGWSALRCEVFELLR